MSLWVYLEDPKAKYGNDVYERNITHNLALMAEKSGLYDAIWTPEKFRKMFRKRTRAKDIVAILRIGMFDLKLNPNYYRQFNAPNGWGMYEYFVEFVEEYLKACEDYPNATIRVSL